MKKLYDRFGSLISGFCLAMIIVVILIAIIARGIFNRPLIWSGELSSMLIIWSIYSVFGTLYKEDTHFRIDIIDTFLNKKIITVLDVLGDLITLISLGFLIVFSIKAIQGNMSIKTAAMSVRVVYAFYFPFLIGCVLFLFAIPSKLIKDIQVLKERSE